ncbi:hypothetical protein IF1G_10830 [Cordyceps javanica]|uniref:Uncharacterized protein n=1 Tax=Cordyceps javanica TaxID=43265 RepID=A0A545UM30_9HYPO|nr:hypothetical protein IF1G_10830 [Cordyceps javanica]
MVCKSQRAASEQAVDFPRLLVSAANKPDKKRMPTRVYMDMHPLHDYEPLRKLGSSWQGRSRVGSCRSLFAVDRVQDAALSSLAQFAKLHHSNLVTPVAFYCVADAVYVVVYEYEGESLSYLPPLPAQDIVHTIYYLVRSGIAFRIRDVRATPDGRAKLSLFPSHNQARNSPNQETVLDWNVETYMEPLLRAANLGYVADEFATLACQLRLGSAPLVAAVVRDLQRDAYVAL